MTPVLRHLILACGWLFLGLGIVGTVLPIWPTTPFLLLAAACFMRSSTRLHRWLLSHPRYGHYLTDYFEGRGLTRRVKVVAIGTMWASILASAALFVPHVAGDLAMVLVAVGVSIYLLRLPTAPEHSAEEHGCVSSAEKPVDH
jgi:uncharacterized membrane protein YbaN (DUF454 family)